MRFRMNRRRWIGLSLAGLAGAGVFGTLFARPALGGPFGPGHGFGRHGHHRFDAEHVRAHVAWWLRSVDATPEQVDEITRIATETARELQGARDRAASRGASGSARGVGAGRLGHPGPPRRPLRAEGLVRLR